MRHGSTFRTWSGVFVVLAGVVFGACETTRASGGFQRDLTPPLFNITAVNDTQDISGGLNFTVTASDNISLKDVRLVFSGGYTATIDSVFSSATRTVTQVYQITFPKNSGAGGAITIAGRATDGAGNFTDDTLRLFLVNIAALQVT